jgi:predicted RNA-binding protein (virulence factor B family)
MVEIGKFSELEVLRDVDFGFYLDAGPLGEILLPNNSAPAGCRAGDLVNVFIYLDSEDRVIATTEKPYVEVGEFALLRVIAVESVGAFMDWGLSKDLMVPFREQKQKLELGRSYVVRVYLDEQSGRIVATAKLDRFLNKTPAEYAVGEEVDLLITRRTDLGYNAIINNAHWGVLYKNEVFQDLNVGQRITGYIKKLRDDEKIDLSLSKPGYGKVEGMAGEIFDLLKQQGGFLSVTSKSSPEEIRNLFGMSKKNFKMAIGSLYKKRLISIDPDGIRKI